MPCQKIGGVIVCYNRAYKYKSIYNDKNCLYRIFKANISCIGLEPEEYETCIKWFCEVMEY